MEKLSAVLNDKESMKQISELAQMLGAQNETAEKNPPQNTEENSAVSALLSSSGAGGVQNSENTSAMPFDMNSLMQLQKIITQAKMPDKNVNFLLALKPLLKKESQAKIDSLVKIFRLMSIYPLIKQSGLGGGDFFGLL